MGQTVYADVLFLINFSMDFLVFYICARLSGKRLFVVRSVIAAAVGGIYGIVSLFLPEEGLIPLICDVLSMLLICAIAFYKKLDRIRDFLGRCALFAGISAILGGVMTAIYTMLNRSGLAALEGDSGDDISIWLFALLAAAGGAAAFVGGRRMRRLSVTKQAEIEITFDSKTARVRGMTDTGNLLTDPLSGRSVAICELEAVRDIIPDELSVFLKSGNAFSSAIPAEYASRLRFIPAKGAIASKTSLLCAVLPDSVHVICEGKRSETDVLIAPVVYKLSAGESRALLPPGIIQ